MRRMLGRGRHVEHDLENIFDSFGILDTTRECRIGIRYCSQKHQDQCWSRRSPTKLVVVVVVVVVIDQTGERYLIGLYIDGMDFRC